MKKNEIKKIKKELLHYLTDDFENNQAIFNKEKAMQYLMEQI